MHSLALAVTILTAGLGAAPAGAGEATAWRTGEALRDQLATPIGVNWVDNPVRQGLANLSRSQQVAIFLDRRVDPGRRVTLACEETPLEEVLRRIADELELGQCIVDSVVYIGPKATAERLPTLSMVKKDQARKLPPAMVKRLAERKPFAWEMLAAPRELIEKLAGEISAQSPDLAFFPHDLWPASEWPAMSAIDRLTLLLAGFDLTFDLTLDENAAARQSGLVLRLAPMPAEVLARREHRAIGDGQRTLERLRELFPEAQIRLQQGKLEVLASAEDHEAIDRALRGESPSGRPTARTSGRPPAASAAGAEKRYTLKTPAQPVGGLAKALGKQLGLEVTLDRSAESRLATPVAIEVREATLEELLDALVAPAGLAYELDGRTLVIKAR